MPAEFNWWLLVVGLVIGAGATWLILAELARHEDEVFEADVTDEATTIADELRGRGTPIDAATVAAVLHLHRAQLRQPPPDDDVEEDQPDAQGLEDQDDRG